MGSTEGTKKLRGRSVGRCIRPLCLLHFELYDCETSYPVCTCVCMCVCMHVCVCVCVQLYWTGSIP